MYQVQFWYDMAKKDNSTRRPANPSTTYDCDIIDGSGMLNPTIELRHNGHPNRWNYAYIDAWSRYYKVNNWTYDRGIWRASLQVDVLASFKYSIEDQVLYVNRCSSTFNGRIVDNAYPIIARKTKTIGSMADGSVNPLRSSYSNGSFVVGIVNTDTSAIGAVSYYVFTPAQFKTLVDKLMGDVGFYQVADISNELTKVLANPFQYIVSCLWFPFTPSVGASISSLKIGWWTFSGITCARLSGNTLWSASGPTILVPKHPEGSSRGYYMYTEPYTEYYLDIPPWGSFNLPADKLIDSTYITCYSTVDCITGMGKLSIDTSDAPNNYITIVNGQIGVPIMLAQMAPQLGNLMNQTVTSASQINPENFGNGGKVLGIDFTEAASNLIGAATSELGSRILDFASSIGTAIISKWCPAQTIGNNGGVMAGYANPHLYATFSYQSDADYAEKGRPLCKRVRLGDLSGFIQCGETDIEIPCTKLEADAIRTYLASGFFLE